MNTYEGKVYIFNYSNNTSYNIRTDYNICNILNNTNKLIFYSWVGTDFEQMKYYIYSLDKLHLDYIINAPQICGMYQFINDKYLLLSFLPNVYLLNLENQEMICVGNNMYYPKISPDLKYIAYTSISDLDLDGADDEKGLNDGFYIKNLETSQTIYFPLLNEINAYAYGVINWVNKKGIEELIGIPVLTERQ